MSHVFVQESLVLKLNIVSSLVNLNKFLVARLVKWSKANLVIARLKILHQLKMRTLVIHAQAPVMSLNDVQLGALNVSIYMDIIIKFKAGSNANVPEQR